MGQTTRDVRQRVAEQLQTAAIKNYRIELEATAEPADGSILTDHEVRAALVKKGFENVELEWMRCTVADVQTVLTELRTGQRLSGTHHATFPMRREQAEAVNKTHASFHSIWKEDMHAVPRFLWNAKMRFGKTFTTYQLAKKLGAKRILVVTFKPAVEDAWQTDLDSHVDFEGWQYLSRNSDLNPTEIDRRKPVVYFGSFKEDFAAHHPGQWNPYGALPQMRLLTYQMPHELIAIASAGEFDLNAFFEASGTGPSAQFKHKGDVQKWLDIIRGSYAPQSVEHLKTGTRPPFPYSDVRLLPYLQHSFWFLPNVAACHAMANLLAERHNTFWHDYQAIVAAGSSAGIGLEAVPPVRKAIGSGFDTKTITLSCGKLTTGITVPQWSSILMLRNLKSPETYFQAALRVQSPWSIKNPNGDNPNEQEILKPACFVFDFAPTRALRQLSEYGIGLAPNEPNSENSVKDLVAFLPVLAYDGANMTQIDAGGILDIAMAGTSATLLARKWESALLVNVDNDTLRRILNNPEALAAVERIEGWRALGDNVIETIINKSETVKGLKNKAKEKALTPQEKQELTAEEKEYKSKRKQIQEKLIKFATRIPAFMYLTDFRENTLQDVITRLEPGLFQSVTGLTVKDFHLLVQLKVFNTEQMNQAVFAFRRYEDASLRYTGIESHPGLTHYGLYDTVVAKE